MIFQTLREFYYDYQMPLAHALHEIDKRGIAVDVPKLDAFRTYLRDELHKNCDAIASQVGKPTVYSKKDPEFKKYGEKGCLNLSSTDQLIVVLKSRGLKIPKDRSTGNESTAEKHLFRMFAESNDIILRYIMTGREFNKILSTYVDAALLNGVLLGQSKPSGTVTGRRSSTANFLGFGTNLQNLPKHSLLGARFRECLVSRPGKIFVMADQSKAEDWIVQGIIADVSGDTRGLDELRSRVNRHAKLAAFIFGKPESECQSKTAAGEDNIIYYLGKKCRHAGNYDMYGQTMSDSLAGEGVSLPKAYCQQLLDKFHQAEPSIKGVFHKYVQNELRNKRELTTPIGRRRVFFNLRSNSDNSATYRDGYAQIPQSTVGDNTGLAVLHCERERPGLCLADWHDAVVLETLDNKEHIIQGARLLSEAFDRTLEFPISGLRIRIPIEFELGTNLRNTKSFDSVRDIEQWLATRIDTTEAETRSAEATCENVA